MRCNHEREFVAIIGKNYFYFIHFITLFYCHLFANIWQKFDWNWIEIGRIMADILKRTPGVFCNFEGSECLHFNITISLRSTNFIAAGFFTMSVQFSWTPWFGTGNPGELIRPTKSAWTVLLGQTLIGAGRSVTIKQNWESKWYICFHFMFINFVVKKWRPHWCYIQSSWNRSRMCPSGSD